MRQVCLLVLAGLLMPVGEIRSQVAETAVDDREAAVRLLESYWTRDVSTRKEAESFFEKQVNGRLAGGHADLAWALNRIHFGRWREAHEAALRLTPPLSKDLDAWYLLVWTQMAVGNVNESLVQMQELGKAAVEPGVDAETRQRTLARLGRLYAFAEGPGRDRAREATLADALTAITPGLDDTDLGAFEDARGQLRNQYTSMVDEKEQNVAEQKEQAAQEQANRTQQINTENASLGERQGQIEGHASKVRADAGELLARMRSDAAPLRSNLSSLDSQIGAARNRAAWIARDLAHFEHLAATEPDPVLRDHYLRQAEGARFSLASQNSRVASLRAQFDSVAGELRAIENEMAAVESQARSELSGLEREAREIDGKLKRNSRELSRMGQPAAHRGYLANFEARVGHLPTFDPFPVEELRAKLLAELKQ